MQEDICEHPDPDSTRLKASRRQLYTTVGDVVRMFTTQQAGLLSSTRQSQALRAWSIFLSSTSTLHTCVTIEPGMQPRRFLIRCPLSLALLAMMGYAATVISLRRTVTTYLSCDCDLLVLVPRRRCAAVAVVERDGHCRFVVQLALLCRRALAELLHRTYKSLGSARVQRLHIRNRHVCQLA
jgi:hypothetical protein